MVSAGIPTAGETEEARYILAGSAVRALPFQSKAFSDAFAAVTAAKATALRAAFDARHRFRPGAGPATAARAFDQTGTGDPP